MKSTNAKWLFLLAATAMQFQGCVKDEEPEPENEVIVVNCPESVTDIDGNVYEVIKIGNQCWMQRNLTTTKYNDGTAIATGLNSSQWQNTTSGAYAIYNDNSDNDATYGKLYNGYAVASGKLCPQGWHIPTDAEFKTLELYLGMNESEIDLTGERGTAEQIGGKLKSTSLWDSPNAGATNSSGFSALPAGTRNSVGDYIVINQYTDFWTSTPYATDDNYLWDHHLYYNGAGVGRIFQTKDKGYSCRCIKD
jgi:uncharacterized protein (TIGR02145 family)